MRDAWPNLRQVFSVQRREDNPGPQKTGTEVFYDQRRFPKDFLSKHPVDLLIVDKGTHTPPVDFSPQGWQNLLRDSATTHRPGVVVEVWPSNAQLWTKGPMVKQWIRRWDQWGYQSRCKLVRATSVGGAIRQNRLLVARVRNDWVNDWQWDRTEADEDVVRPMSNLLTPPGLLRPGVYAPHHDRDRYPDATTDPMPGLPGAWVRTPKGVRRLTSPETARGLGFTKELAEEVLPSVLRRTTSVFHWEYLSHSIIHLDSPRGGTRQEHLKPPSQALPRKGPNPDAKDHPDEGHAQQAFKWRTPDLSPGGTWYRQRLKNLRQAADFFLDSDAVYQDGLERLKRHRKNYNEDGPSPTKLQLLWWEFPFQHWVPLKDGARQNFLKEPPHRITPNAPMDAAMLEAAADFVDELMDLGVVGTVDAGLEVLCNAPMFVVPKPGQEGQWRVIADAFRGGQNSCVGQDPVFLPRLSHILDQMYTGGFSAVVDLSKFFYNFPTHPDDRPYMGVLHPITEVLYTYWGLSMGAGNSPALAGRFGLAFVRMLKERFEEFQGDPGVNSWWTSFSYSGFDPDLGFGYTLTGRDGMAVKIWVFVDDFLIHGPSYEKTCRALRRFLDTAVDCGFLFHAKKCEWPRHTVKYLGFIFDTSGVPCLKIPAAKRERALAMIDHLLTSPGDKHWSRLTLAVMAGTLESLVEATPQHLGHTQLWALHRLIHPGHLGSGMEPYLTYTCINQEVREGLTWWRRFLTTSEGRFARPSKAATLVPTFGDGSGTGTGGTFQLPGRPELRMWKGKWRPNVVHHSSNWKELRTLLETLQRIHESDDAPSVNGTVIFYFTDNSGTYWIGAKGSSRHRHLHALIVEIRLLSVALGCELQVVHIPGLVMIRHGADGLSRGVWLTSLNSQIEERRLLQSIFDPLPFDPSLVWEALPSTTSHRWRHQHWAQAWKAAECFDTLSVWFPPPEVARQAITFMLETWCEKPYTTSALFFVPRVVPSFWWGLSRYLRELPTINPHQRHLNFPPILPIPITVLYLPPHVPALPNPSDHRVDKPPPAFAVRPHRQQADHLRGLQGRLR